GGNLFLGCSRFPGCQGTREIGYRKPGNLRRTLRKGHITHNNLRMKLEIIDEADLSADSNSELSELARLGCLAARKPRRVLMAAPPASNRHQPLRDPPPASRRIH